MNDIELSMKERLNNYVRELSRINAQVALLQNRTKILTESVLNKTSIIEKKDKEIKRLEAINALLQDASSIDNRPISIWKKDQADLFYASSKEIQDAWNKYAEEEARIFQRDYRQVNVMHEWAPPLSFSAWKARQ